MSSDRRGFFKTAAGAAAAVAGVEGARRATGTSSGVHAAAPPSAAAGRFALELDGSMAGFLHSAEGGHATADVVHQAPGESCITRKNLGTLRYDDVQIDCGTGMSAALYEWLQGLFRCDFSHKSGAIVAADFNYKEVGRMSFQNALITEIGMPALDAASKDAAFIKVKIAPESTQRQKPSGATLKPCGPVAAQKKWLAANFRLEIDGLDCKKVTKIDGFTVKQTAVDREPSHLEVPNLVVTLPEADAESFFAWHEDFVINGIGAEKNGSLEYLAPSLGQTLFTVEFENLGIFRMTPEKVEAGSEQIRRVTAEMYCEAMTFSFARSVLGC